MSLTSSAIALLLFVSIVLLLFYWLRDRSWTGYTVMPRRDAVVETLHDEPLPALLPWPAIVERDEGEWLILDNLRIRAVDVIRSDQAVAYYSAWIAAESADAEPRMLRAIVYQAIRQTHAAMVDGIDAIQLDPDNAMSHYLVASLANESGEQDAAESALHHFTEALRLRSDFVAAYVGRGDLWLARKESDKAMADFRLAIELRPQSAVAWFGRASAHLGRQEYAEAIAALDYVLGLKPDWAMAYHGRAVVRNAVGESAAALEDAEQALRLGPPTPELYFDRGCIRRELGQNQLALDDFNRAIRLDGSNPEVFFRRALLWVDQQEHQLALDDLNDALAQDPNSAPALNLKAWILAASPWEELRDGQAALEAARQACELTQHEEFDSLDTLAAAFAANGDFVAACDWQRQAITRIDAELYLPGARARLSLYQSRAACYEIDKCAY